MENTVFEISNTVYFYCYVRIYKKITVDLAVRISQNQHNDVTHCNSLLALQTQWSDG